MHYLHNLRDTRQLGFTRRAGWTLAALALTAILVSPAPRSAAQTSCAPPASGDWVVSTSCTFSGKATAPANVIVQNNAVLTVATASVLDIDFSQFHLLVRQGSRVIVKVGGMID